MQEMELSHQQIEQALQVIRSHTTIEPKIGLILGSGHSSVANALDQAIVIPYQEIPGFPKQQIYGHGGCLQIGYIGEQAVICLQGRAHPYEDQLPEIKVYIRALKRLGVETLFLTNASGSLHASIEPGSLVWIDDHINFQPVHPLLGCNDERYGPRFVAMDEAYDRALREVVFAHAATLNIPLASGVYIAVFGPSYETAAEISAFRTLGADIVGMSTVAEVLLAKHCGMKVAAISTVTNYATGIATQAHDHQHVVATADRAAQALRAVLARVIESGLKIP